MSGPRPARPPAPIVLDGRYVRLEPLTPAHAPDLFRAATPERYEFLFEYSPATEADTAAWVERAVGGADPMFWALIDTATGHCEGRQALMTIVPEHASIEIGNILWGDRMARSRMATEALYLHARHVFEDLGYRRFEWKCNALNQPSRQAALRFGFEYEGLFRQHRIVKGRNRDTAWFAMLDGDWPRKKVEYERWLDPANFETDGAQRTKLDVR